MRWFLVDAGGNWKYQAVPEPLLAPLLAEVRERGADEVSCRPLDRYGLDRGGMVYADCPLESFQLRGLQLGVPSEHVGHFCERLLELPPRKFGEAAYYKLHTYYNCLLLLPAQRQYLLAALGRRLGRAEARAAAFYEGRKAADKLLAETAETAKKRSPVGTLGVGRLRGKVPA